MGAILLCLARQFAVDVATSVFRETAATYSVFV